MADFIKHQPEKYMSIKITNEKADCILLAEVLVQDLELFPLKVKLSL
jgi:hypothetical protein